MLHISDVYADQALEPSGYDQALLKLLSREAVVIAFI